MFLQNQFSLGMAAKATMAGTLVMFLYLVTIVFDEIEINSFEEQLNQQGQRTIWRVRSI